MCAAINNEHNINNKERLSCDITNRIYKDGLQINFHKISHIRKMVDKQVLIGRTCAICVLSFNCLSSWDIFILIFMLPTHSIISSICTFAMHFPQNQPTWIHAGLICLINPGRERGSCLMFEEACHLK